MYSRKDTSPNYIEFSKNQTSIGRFSWSQKAYKGKVISNPAFNYSRKMSWDNSKKDSKSILVKEKEKQSRQLEILLFTMELTSDMESTMDQELAKCNKVCHIATYNRRQVCVTIKKYNVNKPPIRLFTAKENETKKQVAHVNYTLNEIKELSQILGDFMCAEN